MGDVDFTLEGEAEFLAKLEAWGEAERLRPFVEQAAALLLAEAKRLAPRDSGDLEDAIVVVRVEDSETSIVLGVGVPAGAPEFERALATEYGTRAIIIGTPESPLVTWTAKSKSGASMPWLRTAMLNVAPEVKRIFQEAMKPKK